MLERGVRGVVPKGNAEHGDEQAHPEHESDLARHRDHCGPGGRARRRQISGGCGHDRRQREPDADTTDEPTRQDVGGVRRVRPNRQQQDDAAKPEQRRADCGETSSGNTMRDSLRHCREYGHHERSGRDRQTGLDRRVVPHVLQPQHYCEQRTGEGDVEQNRGRVGPREGTNPQQRRFDDGQWVTFGPHPESGDAGKAHRERDEITRRRPAPVRPFDERKRKRADADRDEHCSDKVGDAGDGVVARVRDDESGGDQRSDADRNIDDEHPAPRRLHQQTADHGAEGSCQRADCGPDADRANATRGRS